MQHFVTEMCTRVHISVTKWCIVGYGTGALWDVCNRSIITSLRNLTNLSAAIERGLPKFSGIVLLCIYIWRLQYSARLYIKKTHRLIYWGEPHDGCSCNHRHHSRGRRWAHFKISFGVPSQSPLCLIFCTKYIVCQRWKSCNHCLCHYRPYFSGYSM